MTNQTTDTRCIRCGCGPAAPIHTGNHPERCHVFLVGCRDTEPHAAHTYFAPTGHGVETERRHCEGVCPSWCRDHDIYVDRHEITVNHRHWFGQFVQVDELVTSGSGPRERCVEVTEDIEYLTASEARQLAAQLVEAADLLDSVGGAYTHDEVRLRQLQAAR